MQYNMIKSTSVLSSTLQSHNLHCDDQTPTSAKQLLFSGQLNAVDFIETSPDIEGTLFEAFVEDDYDGKLHLTTLSKVDTNNNGREEIVGISFWREVPSNEMTEWMDMYRISKAITDRKLMSTNSTTRTTSSSEEDHEHYNDLSHNARKRMQLVKSDSMRWLESALQPCINDTGRQQSLVSNSIIQKLTHSWIKIELIAIKRSHRGHHLGNILLGCTLSKAHNKTYHHNEHAILHIAGGGAWNNIPAARLYKRYGFVSIPEHGKGGPFVKPDRDLFVLGNIGSALDKLPWDEMLLPDNPSSECG